MSTPAQSLTFFSWIREGISGLAVGQAGGRAQGMTAVTLTARGSGGAVSGSQTRSVPFFLAGPADVAGLGPGAILRRYPAPGTLDHESDRCPYVELADASLPWRYTPAATPAPSSANLHPWLVLVVGEEGTELTLLDGRVTIDVSAQTGEHALGVPSAPYRFAHVQADGAGHRTARVLSGRRLQAGTDYLAVVVPAYDESGQRSWTGAAAVTIPFYDAWRFRTAVPAGSFEDLAARLQPCDAPASTGIAPLSYPRLDAAPELEVLGALVAMSAEGPVTDKPLPPVIEEDLRNLQLPARDPEGRPIVTLPRYGEAWNPAAPDDSVWGKSLNRDPRHRGVAGLGLEVGIRFQEELVSDVLAHLGALQEARQRMRHAVLGVALSRSLWQRRVPTEPAARLWLLGPALSRLATENGVVGDQVTSENRTIARGTFSAAARRVLRSGPARTTMAVSRPTPAAVLAAANRQSLPPPSTVDGLPLEDHELSHFDVARLRAIAGGVDPEAMFAAAEGLTRAIDDGLKTHTGRMLNSMNRAVQAGRPVPWAAAMGLLATGDADVVRGSSDPAQTVRMIGSELSKLNLELEDRADEAELTEMLTALSALDPNEPSVTPADLGALASGVSAAFDPTAERPPVIMRVLQTIAFGVDLAQPLAPPEPCVGLDRAAWTDVERAFDEWLLPGIGQLPENCVISLQTNPVFVDAFLAGLNSQLLAELRWRNIPIATGCTPIRRFWDRADSSTGARADDIVGLKSWTTESGLGDSTHIAPGASGKELVIAVRGDLFLRYPATLVYLQSALDPLTLEPNFDVDPGEDAPRVLPGFQGRLGEDVAFFGFPGFDPAAIVDHWVVFEEPPSGYRFANDVTTSAASGHTWAAATLAEPVRVLIRGDALFTGGSS